MVKFHSKTPNDVANHDVKPHIDNNILAKAAGGRAPARSESC